MINIKDNITSVVIPVFVMGMFAAAAAFSQRAAIIICAPFFQDGSIYIPLHEARVYIFTLTIFVFYLCYIGGYITGNQIFKARK